MRRYGAPFVGVAVGTLLLLAPRSHVGSPRREGQQIEGDVPAFCKDSAGDPYSPGAIVEVHGQLMQCVVGPHWQLVEPTEGGADSSTLDVSGENVGASRGASIVDALKREVLPPLECEKILNSTLSSKELLQVASGTRLLVFFWTPTCLPCKPLLAELAVFAETYPQGVSILGVVQSANPEVEPPGEWRMRRGRRTHDSIQSRLSYMCP